MERAAGDRRKLKGALTRERILDVAIDLFSSHGYAATGVSEIARRAGIEKAALYWHFGSKEDLLAAVVERIDTGWIEQIQKQVTAYREPYERLDLFIEGLQRLVSDQSHLLRLILNVALERSDVSPQSRHAVQRILQRTGEVILEEFEAGLGVRLPDGDLIARLSVGYLLEGTLRSAVDPDSLDLDRFFRHLRRLIALDVGIQMQRAGLALPLRPEREQPVPLAASKAGPKKKTKRTKKKPTRSRG